MAVLWAEGAAGPITISRGEDSAFATVGSVVMVVGAGPESTPLGPATLAPGVPVQRPRDPAEVEGRMKGAKVTFDQNCDRHPRLVADYLALKDWIPPEQDWEDQSEADQTRCATATSFTGSEATWKVKALWGPGAYGPILVLDGRITRVGDLSISADPNGVETPLGSARLRRGKPLAPPPQSALEAALHLAPDAPVSQDGDKAVVSMGDHTVRISAPTHCWGKEKWKDNLFTWAAYRFWQPPAWAIEEECQTWDQLIQTCDPLLEEEGESKAPKRKYSECPTGDEACQT